MQKYSLDSCKIFHESILAMYFLVGAKQTRYMKYPVWNEKYVIGVQVKKSMKSLQASKGMWSHVEVSKQQASHKDSDSTYWWYDQSDQGTPQPRPQLATGGQTTQPFHYKLSPPSSRRIKQEFLIVGVITIIAVKVSKVKVCPSVCMGGLLAKPLLQLSGGISFVY